MIDAKNLAKAMKSAAKVGGYRIYEPAEGKNLYIWTLGWCVVLDADRVPRLVLATIVEQTGELPEPGVCGLVTEDGMQTIMQDTAEAAVSDWTDYDTENESAVKLAPIRYRGMLIYQAEQLCVYATGGAGLSIIERSAAKSAVAAEENRLFYTADGECLILRCSRPSQNHDTLKQELPVWAALESCDLGAIE